MAERERLVTVEREAESREAREREAQPRERLDETINKLLEDQFGPSKAGALKDSMFFVDFLRDGDEDPETGEELAPPQIYEPVDSLVSCRERVKMFCGRFNDLYKLNAVDMVLFDDALMHFMRICRIMRTPRARLSAARGRGRFGQANPHAPWSIRGRLHLLSVHHHEAVQLAEPDGRLQAALYAGGHQEQGRDLHLHYYVCMVYFYTPGPVGGYPPGSSARFPTVQPVTEFQ